MSSSLSPAMLLEQDRSDIAVRIGALFRLPRMKIWERGMILPRVVVAHSPWGNSHKIEDSIYLPSSLTVKYTLPYF
jgi:hypothetical protein